MAKPSAPESESNVPRVRDYMAAMPWTIGRTQTLTAAHRIMREHDVRHLPVLDAGRLAGMISERDLALVESMPGLNPTNVRVEEAMTSSVYGVEPDAALGAVALEMAEKKLGSAVVMEKDRVVGVFTTVDALRALADVIKRRF